MSIISRITTWGIGQLLKSSDLNGEFNNIINTVNNLDAGSTVWDVVSTKALTASAATSLAGANLNSSKITNLANGTASTDAAAFGQISGVRILQIVTGAMGNSFSTTSTSFVVATGSTLVVTPISSSSTIVLVAIGLLSTSNPNADVVFATIMNATTPLHIGTNGIVASNDNGNSATTQWGVPVTMLATNAPGAITAQTYNVGLKVSAGTGLWNGGRNGLGLFMAFEVG